MSLAEYVDKEKLMNQGIIALPFITISKGFCRWCQGDGGLVEGICWNCIRAEWERERK